MDRIAIISDIHGNLTALKTVLDDIKQRGITKIFCLGDIIGKGNHPSECLKLILENCEVVLKGNVDDYFTTQTSVDSELGQKRIDWNRSLLTEEDIEKIKQLPFCYEIYMSGSLVRLFHASPSSLYGAKEYLERPSKKIEQFKPSEHTISNKYADIVIYGHVHSPFLQRFYNRTIINTGSVGNSIDVFRSDELDGNIMETTQCSYIIIEGELNSSEYNSSFGVQFVRLPYNIDKELSDQDNNIEKEAYESELKEGKYRDMPRILNELKKYI